MADGERSIADLLPQVWRVYPNKGGGWTIRQDSGKGATFRRSRKHADEVAEMLNMGYKPPREGRQYLNDLVDVKLIEEESHARRYKIVTCRGNVPVVSFKDRFRAEWWLESYELWREEEIARRGKKTYELDSAMVDKLHEVWFVADEKLDLEKRVEEIKRKLLAEIE